MTTRIGVLFGTPIGWVRSLREITEVGNYCVETEANVFSVITCIRTNVWKFLTHPDYRNIMYMATHEENDREVTDAQILCEIFGDQLSAIQRKSSSSLECIPSDYNKKMNEYLSRWKTMEVQTQNVLQQGKSMCEMTETDQNHANLMKTIWKKCWTLHNYDNEHDELKLLMYHLLQWYVATGMVKIYGMTSYILQTSLLELYNKNNLYIPKYNDHKEMQYVWCGHKVLVCEQKLLTVQPTKDTVMISTMDAIRLLFQDLYTQISNVSKYITLLQSMVPDAVERKNWDTWMKNIQDVDSIMQWINKQTI